MKKDKTPKEQYKDMLLSIDKHDKEVAQARAGISTKLYKLAVHVLENRSEEQYKAFKQALELTLEYEDDLEKAFILSRCVLLAGQGNPLYPNEKAHYQRIREGGGVTSETIFQAYALEEEDEKRMMQCRNAYRKWQDKLADDALRGEVDTEHHANSKDKGTFMSTAITPINTLTPK